jgi:hypothetical protein
MKNNDFLLLKLKNAIADKKIDIVPGCQIIAYLMYKLQHVLGSIAVPGVMNIYTTQIPFKFVGGEGIVARSRN